MRRWIHVGTRPVLWRRSTVCTTTVACRQLFRFSQNATTKLQPGRREKSLLEAGPNRPFDEDAIKDDRISEKTVDDLVAALDRALPSHFRQQPLLAHDPELSAQQVAEILLGDHYATESKAKGSDLLHHIGFVQGRWSAVVWLVKLLVDDFPLKMTPDIYCQDMNDLWNPYGDLDSATRRPVMLYGNETYSFAKKPHFVTLDDLTGGQDFALDTRDGLDAYAFHEDHPSHASTRQCTPHDVLGQIWRSLGRMTLECAGGDIRPEILEIIAYLHHREIMPLAIYFYDASLEKTAIQQPPLIPLLSSKMLTSLSDAAWKAEQRLAGQSSKARPDSVTAVQSRATVRLEGIRPEVWLELILWSCLHGGWIQEGAFILYSIATNPDWSPLSWREHEKSLPSISQLNDNDWNGWEYVFKTRPASSMDQHQGANPTVERTVSAEVVNAYIDALASATPSSGTIEKLALFKRFLQKMHLGLSFGSWDGLVARVLGAEDVPLELHPHDLMEAVRLSPGLGQGLEDKNSQDLPPYILDNGSAMTGILHRVLWNSIIDGDLKMARKVLKRLQRRADDDKMTSLTSFLEGNKPLFKALSANEMFTSNFAGIEYPGFDLQIPASTLGRLLALAIRQKELDWARTLIYSEDLDGPVISEAMYHDPLVAGPLVEFAAKYADRTLLVKLKSISSQGTRPTIFDLHVDAMRWNSALRILSDPATDAKDWHIYSLANLASKIIFLSAADFRYGDLDRQAKLRAARELFCQLYQKYSQYSRLALTKAQSLLTVLSTVDKTCADLCWSIAPDKGFHDFICVPVTFNRILSAVLTVHGSAVGRRVLQGVWPAWTRQSGDDWEGERSWAEQRLVVRSMNGKRSVVYGHMQPTAQTILPILDQAMVDLKKSSSGSRPTSASDAVFRSSDSTSRSKKARLTKSQLDSAKLEFLTWTVEALMDSAVTPRFSDAIEDVDEILAKHGEEELRQALPGIAERAFGGARYVDSGPKGMTAARYEDTLSQV